MSVSTHAGWLQEVYTHQQDSTFVTPEVTEALLKQLQRALPATSPAGTQQLHPQPAAAATPSLVTASLASLPAATAQHLQLLSAYESSIKTNRASISGSSDSSSTASQSPAPAAANLQPFIAAAGDVLSYLRHQQSKALLPMLRDFSRNGLQGFGVFAANPVTLRQEVQQLLQPAGLQQWYADAAKSRVDPTKAADQQAVASALSVSLLAAGHVQMLRLRTLPKQVWLVLACREQQEGFATRATVLLDCAGGQQHSCEAQPATASGSSSRGCLASL
jgi:hypothetical protein